MVVFLNDSLKFLPAMINLRAHQWLTSFLEKAVVLRINLLQVFLKEIFTPSIALVNRFPRCLSAGNTSLKAFQISVHQKFASIFFIRLNKSFTVFLLRYCDTLPFRFTPCSTKKTKLYNNLQITFKENILSFGCNIYHDSDSIN